MLSDPKPVERTVLLYGQRPMPTADSDGPKISHSLEVQGGMPGIDRPNSVRAFRKRFDLGSKKSV
jgi:hypothetical protein